ncbi:MAG: branched-chain amino acid ABC transporter permease, partial [Acidimicrobiia bacterium]
MSRRARLAWFWLAAITIVVLSPLASVAAGESIGGKLIQTVGGERSPVEGVTVIVLQDGVEIGTGQSDAEGAWEIPVPAVGVYDAQLDTSTLPDGVGLTDPEKEVLTDINVREGQAKKVIFPLGEGSVSSVSTSDRVGALFVSGLKLGAIIALCAVGLSLVYG